LLKRGGITFVLLALTAAPLTLFLRMRAARNARVDCVDHCRRVLADGHYVAPPGDNVDELVSAGLNRWPGDGDLLALRVAAEHEMITMAIAARSSGDIVGARELSSNASRLDPNDKSARMMKSQTEDELAAIVSSTTPYAGPPRLIFESPPVVKTGSTVELSGRIIVGAATVTAEISGLALTVRPNGQAAGDVPIVLTQIDARTVRGTLTAPRVGSWDVSFQADVSGVRVRALRDLDVVE
jgi:hypothetical protein